MVLWLLCLAAGNYYKSPSRQRGVKHKLTPPNIPSSLLPSVLFFAGPVSGRDDWCRALRHLPRPNTSRTRSSEKGNSPYTLLVQLNDLPHFPNVTSWLRRFVSRRVLWDCCALQTINSNETLERGMNTVTYVNEQTHTRVLTNRLLHSHTHTCVITNRLPHTHADILQTVAVSL